MVLSGSAQLVRNRVAIYATPSVKQGEKAMGQFAITNVQVAQLNAVLFV